MMNKPKIIEILSPSNRCKVHTRPEYLSSCLLGVYIEVDKGICTLWWPCMDVTMVVFHVFFRYKKINKIKTIQIIKKGTRLSKAIIINLPKMNKSNQNHG